MVKRLETKGTKQQTQKINKLNVYEETLRGLKDPRRETVISAAQLDLVPETDMEVGEKGKFISIC